MKTRNKKKLPMKVDDLESFLKEKFEKNPDLVFSKYEQQNGKKVGVCFIGYQVDTDKVEEFLLQPLLSMEEKWTNKEIINRTPLNDVQTSHSLEEILQKLLVGEVFIYVEGEKEILSYLLLNKEKRSLEKAETESLVLGPKIGFTESIVTNMNIVRWRIKSTDLVLEDYTIGKLNPRDIRLIYLKSIANEEDVNTMRQRIKELDVDEVEDSAVLSQYLADSQSNIFPSFQSTELPDRFTYAITKGKVGILMENSPTGIIAPANLFSFIESTEDLYMNWYAGTFLRLLRFIAMFFTVIVTPLYVAIITYQYSIVPTQLLISIGQSRAAVPFPPLIEALILEFLIELLREAGARLPTKVGQTMGIVGGIVIGQAAVAAGLTSNILIIVVAMSALASYTSPSYLLGTTIRIIRFPLILLAGLFGLIGIMFGLCFLIIHLLRLTSLGRSYLIPLYPLQLQDFNKVFYRTPFKFEYKRAKSYLPRSLYRFSKKDAGQKRDIDE
ncbi:spore germination protein [Virgibacillus halodenitrificans]|uniref:spore germination protein n=1 Tax=Virgibacillus halodenitrificans TaxID=1482 RepID=UPI000319405E|nr:spore germination protein [Virgibacillus halodenitrificans]WHX24791.1 spore germination protein [Virgibacillus halodenitrificans]